MLNMATMAADECRQTPEENAYERWISDVEKVLERPVQLNSDEESDLFDLYSDKCSPQEAVDEIRAQA
jgi:hypothetical protein